MNDAAHFALDWLALREPADHRSRAASLVAPLNAWLQTRGHTPTQVADLGAGSGSNWRYLAPRLPTTARWRLLDHDAVLLARGGVPADVQTEVHDLRAAALADCIAGADLVTASALIDLCSAAWLTALAGACQASGAALLIALTIDGHTRFQPADPEDPALCAALAADEQRDKGLGPALGPKAAQFLQQQLQARGYTVICEPSDWRLNATTDASLLRTLLAGWHAAAIRQQPARSADWDAWLARRLQAVGTGACQLTVGHVDLLALPPA